MRETIEQCVALIGLDWADKKHDICLKQQGCDELEYSVIQHGPKAIDQWAMALRQRFPQGRIALCLEQRKGPVVYALLKYDFFVLVPVNPQTLAGFRRAFKPSRAKDDPTDAALMVELLERHADKLTAWQPEAPAVRQLQLLVEMRRSAVADKVRITNRLTASLKSYYPDALQWFTDTDTQVFADFILRWPTLKKAQRARADTVRSFFQNHNIRYHSVINRRIEAIAAAMPLTNDKALIDSYSLQATSFAKQLKLVLTTIAEYDQAIADCFTTLPDADLFSSLPGAGKHLAPRLLAAFGTDRDRWPRSQAFLQYSGIAPVKEASGKKTWVHWRWNCPTFLRQTFIEWAGQSISKSFWAKAYYQQQRAKGSTHQMAVRSLAFKWIRIVHRCWLDGKPYDESRYLMALHKKGSPLLANYIEAQKALSLIHI